ncbi:MAG: ion transporter [Spirochaetales bacterium]|nr:ion transporter [Spirochaetales bacterium]
MEKNKISVFEIIVSLVIVLVVIHTFLEDFFVLIGLDGDLGVAMIIAGFFFDLFFTIEFLLRLYWARSDRGSLFYFTYQHGWIDFFASVPLLMFNSGPPFVSLASNTFGLFGIAGIAGLSMLKLLKIIRIARILRLLRILKIFKNIKYTDSSMAQRHVNRIITLGVTVLVVLLILFTMVMDVFSIARPDDAYVRNRYELMKKINENIDWKDDPQRIANDVKRLDASGKILLLKSDGKVIFSRYPQNADNPSYTYRDYEYSSAGNVEIYFDVTEENRIVAHSQSRDNLVFFFIILGLLCAYLIFYSPHFALTVTDPLYVMRRGFREKDYNLEVKIPPLYETDDVYDLAKLYNEHYLPAKDRLSDKENSTLLTAEPDDIKYLTDI